MNRHMVHFGPSLKQPFFKLPHFEIPGSVCNPENKKCGFSSVDAGNTPLLYIKFYIWCTQLTYNVLR